MAPPARCAWCSRPIPRRPGGNVGRPAKYCRRSCRQRAFEARRRGEALGVSDDELVIARNELDDVNDRLFEISLAAKDAELQYGDGMDPAGVLERLLSNVDRAIGTN